MDTITRRKLLICTGVLIGALFIRQTPPISAQTYLKMYHFAAIQARDNDIPAQWGPGDIAAYFNMSIIPRYQWVGYGKASATVEVFPEYVEPLTVNGRCPNVADFNGAIAAAAKSKGQTTAQFFASYDTVLLYMPAEMECTEFAFYQNKEVQLFHANDYRAFHGIGHITIPAGEAQCRWANGTVQNYCGAPGDVMVQANNTSGFSGPDLASLGLLGTPGFPNILTATVPGDNWIETLYTSPEGYGPKMIRYLKAGNTYDITAWQGQVNLYKNRILQDMGWGNFNLASASNGVTFDGVTFKVIGGTSTVIGVNIVDAGGGPPPADATPPVITLQSAPQSPGSQVYTITTGASDNVAVTAGTLVVDGQPKGSFTTSLVVTMTLSTGVHTIVSTASDAAGNTAEAKQGVTRP